MQYVFDNGQNCRFRELAWRDAKKQAQKKTRLQCQKKNCWGIEPKNFKQKKTFLLESGNRSLEYISIGSIILTWNNATLLTIPHTSRYRFRRYDRIMKLVNNTNPENIIFRFLGIRIKINVSKLRWQKNSNRILPRRSQDSRQEKLLFYSPQEKQCANPTCSANNANKRRTCSANIFHTMWFKGVADASTLDDGSWKMEWLNLVCQKRRFLIM